MKKIFPIITILILFSLLGLIFFQYMWIKSAKDIKDKQVEDNIVHAQYYAATILTQDKSSLMPLFRAINYRCSILNHLLLSGFPEMK
jgi:hypothetical protein